MRLISLYLLEKKPTQPREKHHHRPGDEKDTHNSHLDRVAARGRRLGRQTTNKHAGNSIKVNYPGRTGNISITAARAVPPLLDARATRLLESINKHKNWAWTRI